MKLKVKLLKFSAGRPVAILNEDFAIKSSIQVDERILIKDGGKSLIAVVDVAKEFVKKDEIAVSSEVIKELGISEKDLVSIEIVPKPKSVLLIQKKLNCERLSKDQIYSIISDIVKNALTEAEIAYFVSAVYKCGMSIEETINMTKSIFKTGEKLNLKNRLIVDKHSIGGIPGRVTPILVSICAAAGLIMPKTSSRAITTPAGTADAMEYLTGVDFTVKEIKKIVKKTNACIVWGGSLGLAPADDKIIQVERLLNLDPKPQLISSIMAKKLAVGAKYVLIDIPYGKNAKVNKKEAKKLAEDFKRVAKEFKIKMECILTQNEEPLGNGIGPALEMEDVIKVLKRKSPCHLLEDKSIELSGKIFELTKKAKKGKGKDLAMQILNSGKAFIKFNEIIEAQGGKIKPFSESKFKQDIISDRSGEIKEINTKKINTLARIAGAPLDKLSGLYLHKHVKDSVKKGEKILTIYSETRSELDHAIDYFKKEKTIVIK